MTTAPLALLACAFALRAADGPSVIRVTARYPGASVQVLDATVALPLLKQIQGTEGVTRTESESAKDGTCAITVRLDAKTDPMKMQDVIRKRVALAEPVIPEKCKRSGITVRTDPAQPVEFWFALTDTRNPDDVRDLADHARQEYADVLRRIPGVNEVRVLGTTATDSFLRITLDKEKLRARAVSVEEVRAAVQATNDVVTITATDPSPKGDPRLVIRISGQLSTTPKTLDEIVIKLGNGQNVLLRDVSRLELGSKTPNELTTFGGKPAALLAVIANRDATLEQLEPAIDLLRKAAPPGMQFTMAVTPVTPRVLRLEVLVPDARTMEYTQEKCKRVMESVLVWNDGLPAISFTDRLQTNRAELLVTCKPDADADALQKRLAGEIREATIRICDVTGGKPAFPVRVALAGPDAEHLWKWSEAIRTRARKDALVNDVADWPGRDVTRHEMSFNKEKAEELGISLGKALESLNSLTEMHKFRGEKPDELNNLFLKNAKGELVPFTAFATLNPVVESASIYRLGLERAIRITANAADGKSVTDCAEKLHALAESEKANLKLATGYRAVILVP
ncbi:efflux RND transporter permease subunit [Fimbriiglobus ruber]|uniref:Multidrug efflux transporter MexF n=1 Tax=Fimbriiglobus ruber TaxID=1908690 RepID=A0A225DW71_9BACT|nr:efflux RND transporter permease subunit [Fimbriiglobus ruber]OWK45632.1 Multidrug efflux transporter MexF [Fimbriiglobus ruber]